MTAVDDRPTSVPAAASRGYRGLLSDLRLGARLAVGGGRASFIRLGLMAFAIGMCVTLLLIGASIGRAGDNRSARIQSMQPTIVDNLVDDGSDTSNAGARARASAAFEAHLAELNSGRHHAVGFDVAARVANPPLPPGVSVFPRVGELVVSPALAALLRSPAGAGLRPRLNGPIVGIIGDAGLADPHELRFYQGIARSPDPVPMWSLAGGWGHGVSVASPDGLMDINDKTIMVTGVTVLIVPLLIFISIASRVGAAARSRRLAAIRLIGGSGRQIRRFAIAEALLASTVGVLVGIGGYLIARLFAPSVSISGSGFFVGDVRPNPVLAALTVLLVPALTIGSVLAGHRRVVIEPLGIQRTGRVRRRRLLWRLAVVLVAAAALVAFRGPGTFGFAPGVALAIICIPVLAPYLIERLAARTPPSGTAWQLAVRRLQADSGTGARVVSGLAVVLCATVALLPLFGYVGARIGQNTQNAAPAREGTGDIFIRAAPSNTIEDARDAVARVPGTAPVTAIAGVPTGADGTGPGAWIASCASLRTFVVMPDCHDGDVVNVTGTVDGQHPTPGSQLEIYGNDGHSAFTTLPNVISSVPATASQWWSPAGLYLTPGALNGAAAGLLNGRLDVQINMTTASLDDAGYDRVRNALAEYGWRVGDSQFGVGATLTHLGEVMTTARSGLLIGGSLVLLVAVLSMLVLSVEQITERRRALTMAVASGVPRSVLARSSIYAVLAPAVVAVVLADLVGSLITLSLAPNLLDRLTVNPIELIGLSLATLAALAVITAATLPALRRLTRPDALRTE